MREPVGLRILDVETHSAQVLLVFRNLVYLSTFLYRLARVVYDLGRDARAGARQAASVLEPRPASLINSAPVG